MERLSTNNPFGAPTFFIEKTPSTMTEAKEYVRELRQNGFEPVSGTTIVADFQSEGRGRIRARSWLSPPGMSILATLIIAKSELDNGIPLPTVSIHTAVALTRYLEKRHSLKSEIKWPNDVLVEERKISGVLCEFSDDLLYIGIGLNCRRIDFGEKNWADSVTSIRQETGYDVDRNEELFYLLKEVREVLRSATIREAESRLYRRDRTVQLVEGNPDNGTVCEGKVEGLGEDGALLLRTMDGNIKRVTSGEFSLRH